MPITDHKRFMQGGGLGGNGVWLVLFDGVTALFYNRRGEDPKRDQAKYGQR